MLAHAPTQRAAAGACARPNEPTVGVVPAVSDVIPRGEGFLVTIVASSERSLGRAAEMRGSGTASMFDVGTRLERDGQSPIALRIVELGPGVARFEPARDPAAGRWRAVSREGSVELTFGSTPAAPIAAPPSLASAHTTTVTSQGPRGGGTYRSSTAELGAPVGLPEWQGIVVYQASSATTEAPLAARALNGTSATQLLYADPGRCGFYAPGQSAPTAGSLVRVALYDLWGRMSARSNQVRVGE